MRLFGAAPAILRVFVGSALAALSACGRPSVPGDGVDASPARASAQVSAPPAPRASASSPPELDAPPIPDAPPGVDRDKLVLAASICAVALDGNDVVCRFPPPFDRAEKKPDGKLPRFAPLPGKDGGAGDLSRDAEGATLVQVFRGAFSRPGATEAVLAFCTWNSSMVGYTVLVERTKGRWQARAYGDYAASCLQSRRADGHDVLLCHGGGGGDCSGLTPPEIYQLDFAGGAQRRDVMATLPLSEVACWMTALHLAQPNTLHVESRLHFSRFADFRLADLNRDGVEDLVADVEHASVGPSPALDAKAKTVCPGNPNGSLLAFLPRPTKTTLEFVSHGNRMLPTSVTTTRLEAMR